MRRREYLKEQKLKKVVYIFCITLIISIIAFLSIFVMYSKKMREESSNNLLELGKMNDIVSNEELSEASYSSDLSVNKVNNLENTNTSNVVDTSNVNNVNKTNSVSKIPVESKVENTVQNIVTNESVEKKELSFSAPVSGDIIKDFAMDTLIYSNTLEEWTTHSGIDIKSDKTTVVAAAESGIVESIKNDPRYGLTITINHGDGFKTIYSNLLTTEFITENEEVEKGQTIATIGDSASFEVSDEPHLHFEMYKDGMLVNPTIYLK